MNKKATLSADYSATRIKGRIKTLVKALFQLAPNPNRSAHHGPVFISLNSAFNPCSESDGLMGGLILEGFLGGVFAQAGGFANDNSALHGALGALHHDFVDAASHYIEDRAEHSHNNYGHGRGSIALYEDYKRSASPLDNGDDAVISYKNDLPERLRIESHIAALVRDMDALAL